MTTSFDYVPALGRHGLTGLYDGAVAIMTRERRWRRDLLRLIDLQPRETIVDIGCGTGTLAIALKTRCPDAQVYAADPDPRALDIARRKADARGVAISWIEALGSEVRVQGELAGCDKVASSLVLHQCALDMKTAILSRMRALLKPGGKLFIADYGAQRTPFMRLLFRQIQWLDGFERTEPNALDCIPAILAAEQFSNIAEIDALPTPSGSISLYRAER